LDEEMATWRESDPHYQRKLEMQRARDEQRAQALEMEKELRKIGI
jgi:hypothetical protein